MSLFDCQFANNCRTVFYKTLNDKRRTVYRSYPYSDPEQITVRSSYWAQRYFNAEPFRDALLFRLTRSVDKTENGKLDFTSSFALGDEAIIQFNDVPVAERKFRFKGSRSDVPEQQVKQIYRNMNRPNQDTRVRKVKPEVCDYASWEELDTLISAQKSLSTINGLPNAKDKISIDRTLIGDTVRYDWKVQVMGWHDNDAKVAGRFIFQDQEALDYWVSVHTALTGMNNHQVVAYELRIRYKALLEKYYSRVNPGGEEPVAPDEDYEVDVDDDAMADIDDD